MDLIQELNLKDFTEEEKNDLLVQFTDSLLKRLVVRVYDKLSSEDQQELDKLTAAGDQEKINQFLSAKVPDLDEIRDQEVSELKEEMKDFLSAAKKS